MPTYDYVCDACDHAFELYQSITADAEKKCPECGKRKLRRLFGTGAAIMFKGSGFYTTDYRSESYKQRAAADKPAESKPAECGTADCKCAAPAATDAASNKSDSSDKKGGGKSKSETSPRRSKSAKK